MPTPNLKLQTLTESQESKELTVNENMYLLDALLQGVAGQQNTPPGSPNPGDAYIVTATATGAWANQENRIAYYFNGGWSFLIPSNGLTLFDSSQSTIIYFSGIWKTFLGSNPVTAETLTNSGTAYVTAGTPSVVPITLTANTTITLPTPPGTGRYSVEYWLYQDNTGGRAVTWASTSGTSIQWDSSFTAPTIATAAQLLTQLEFKIRYPDTRWRGRKVWQESQQGIVVLQLSGTSFADESPNPKTITNNGGVLANQTVGGITGFYFSGVDCCLTTPAVADFIFTGDFTIEFRMRPEWWSPDGNANACPLSLSEGLTGAIDKFFLLFGLVGSIVYYDSTTRISSGSIFSLNVDYHIAIVRTTGVIKLYIDGVKVGSDYSNSSTFSPSVIRIGASYTSVDGEFKGIIRLIRFTKDFARYTANFIPPTSF